MMRIRVKLVTCVLETDVLDEKVNKAIEEIENNGTAVIDIKFSGNAALIIYYDDCSDTYPEDF